MGVSAAGTPDRQCPERGAGDETGRQVAGSGSGLQTAAGRDPMRLGRGPRVGAVPFSSPGGASGVRPAVEVRRRNFASRGLGSHSPAGTSGRTLGSGARRGAAAGLSLGPREDLTLPFPAPFCVSIQTASGWESRCYSAPGGRLREPSGPPEERGGGGGRSRGGRPEV